MKFSSKVVFTFDGISREYYCHSYFDAVMLADGLRRAYLRSEIELVDLATNLSAYW